MKNIEVPTVTTFLNTEFVISMESKFNPNHEDEVGTPKEVAKAWVDFIMLWEAFCTGEKVNYVSDAFGTLTYSVKADN